MREKTFEPRSNIEEWHYKLGNLNERNLKEMGLKGTVLGLNLKKMRNKAHVKFVSRKS